VTPCLAESRGAGSGDCHAGQAECCQFGVDRALPCQHVLLCAAGWPLSTQITKRSHPQLKPLTRLLTCDDIELAKASGGRVEYVRVNSGADGKRAGVTHATHAIRTGTNPKAAAQSSPKSQVSGLHDKNACATNGTGAYQAEAKIFSVLPLSNTGFD
jgi:hypothetical protein